jgi:cbb3-type cytochrome oxidase subunit 3
MRVIDGLMSRLGMAPFAVISMVLFFGAFVGIVIWTWTRPNREIDEQANLWKDDEDRRP